MNKLTLKRSGIKVPKGFHKFVIYGFILVTCAFFVKSYFFSFSSLKKASIPNASIAYYNIGNGYPLILLSGFGMTMQHWDPLLLENLSINNQLIISDYRGIGASTGYVSKSSHEMALDIVYLMDQLKIEKANILGWSQGSFIAQVMAENHPERINKLILISTAPAGNQVIDGPKEIGDYVQKNIAGSWEKTFVPYLFANDKSKQDYLSRLKWAQWRGEVPTGKGESTEAKIAVEIALSNKTDENKRNSSLSGIKSPTLIIVGQEDKFLPPENSMIVAKRIPGSQIVVIQQAGHAVLFEKAPEVARLIDQFLQKK